MSLIKLFDKTKSKHIQKPTNLNELLEDVESVDYIEEYITDKYKFESLVDYSTASNFAIYGSAEEYYDSAIESIYQNYPYDGSAKEKLQWVNKSNPLQIYLFEKEYPRTNGFVVFNPSNSISTISTSGSANNHRNPTVKEYIFLKGGPNIDNIWNTSSYRSSNLEINGNKGNTVEFWLKKDAFSTSNRREVLLDVWSSSSLPGHHEYARYTIELDQQNAAATKSPFVITYRSGSAGVHQAELGSSHLAASASDGLWHHYAITTQNTGSSLGFEIYVDGELDKAFLTGSSINKVNRKLVGTIGALATGKAGKGEAEDPPYTTNANLGWGKLSGSLDEFRYWKIKRSSKEIGRNWFTQVNGGTNTDDANTKLGVYYKFNEGITLTSSIDRQILDYSGRLTNGLFVGYTTSNRSTDSAIVKSGVATSEFKDPILYTENPRLSNYINKKKYTGQQRDLSNTSCLFHTLPGWIIEEDGDRGNTKKLLQILGSYFDVLHLQIKRLATLKHISYENYDEVKPFPFMSQILSSFGLETTEMFHNATALEVLVDKTEEFSFEEKLHNVKNLIYKNLYNSLLYINKSKGTERAFRNILRTHGIDEEIVKLKTYSDNATYEIRPNYDTDLTRKRYINFQNINNQKATIFQFSSSFGLDSPEMPTRGFITGSELSSTGLSSTTQAEVIFPHLFPMNDNFIPFVPTPVSSSIFGAHTVQQGDSTTNLTFRAQNKDFASFQVLVAKEKEDSRNARFILKSRSGVIAEQQTKIFRDVYSDTKWNLALRITPSGSSFGNLVSGSNNTYTVELYGVNVDSGMVKNKFTLRQDVTKAQGEAFSRFSKRLFIGAHRTNFTGSIIEKSDVKISSVRHWLTYLDDETIRRHAIDPKNYGVKNPYQNSFTLNEGVDTDISRIDTLALHWDFSMITGSTSGGNLIIQDFSSGSTKKVNQFGDLGQIVAYNHPAKGQFFQANSTSSVSLEYVPSYRQKEFENIVSSDMVQVLSNDDQTFTRESRPINYIFSFEKSMYRTISQEMVDLFATVKDFSSVIGDPIDKYRQSYKPLDKLRALFFQNVENDPDVEKYIEFYRWIDESLSAILDQYKPASAIFTDGIKNIVESHALERNKYWTKFPTIEFKQTEPEGRIFGINELMYDWINGHAPIEKHTGLYAPSGNLGFPQSENCLWWKDRINRKDSRVSTGDAAVDAERETLRRRINTVASGSTYKLRRLTKPYKLESGFQHVLHGGSNFHLNKKLDFFKGTTNPNSNDFIRVRGPDINAGTDCDDVHIPKYRLQGGQVFEKRKFRGPADISDTNRDHDIDTVLPFSLYSSSIDVPKDYKAEIYKHFKKGVEITNLHDDSYGDDREIPIQGPFTQHHVGGHFHRHIELNRSASLPAGKHDVSTYKTGLDGRSDRREAFFITASDGQLYVLGPDMRGPTGSHETGLFKVSLTGTYAGRSNVLRDPLAKRPLNIRNIKTSTSSLNLGNYQHDYQVVLGTSTEMSKDHILENEKKQYSVDMFLSHSSDLGGYINVKASLTSEQSSSHFFGFKDRVRPSRKTNKHTITSRFSAPGGPETAGTAHGGAHIDVGTNQYSLYNSMNYRNLTPRMMLDVFSAEKSEAFGHRFLSSVTASTPSASYHKVNRNHRYGASANGGDNDIFVRSDNLFVQHQIPQTDLGYAWIRNSTLETTGSYRRLESDFTDLKGTSTQTSSSPQFLSASEIGSFKTNLNVSLLGATNEDSILQQYPQSRLLLATKQIVLNDKNRFHDFTPVDFVGLNTIVVDTLNEDTDTIGHSTIELETDSSRTSTPISGQLEAGASGVVFTLSDYNYTADDFLKSDQRVAAVGAAGGFSIPSGQMIENLSGSDAQNGIGVHLLFNSIIANRGGQYGYPSWKQLRAGQHPVARRHRKNNVMTFAASLGEVPVGIPENVDPDQYRRRGLHLFAKSEYNWPDKIDFVTKTNSRTSENILTRFTESVGTNVRQPIRFVKYYHRAAVGFVPIPPNNPDGLTTDAESYTDISFTNLIGNFANKNLKSFLRIDGAEYQDYIQSFSYIDSVSEANVISYAESIFPKEENLFLNKIRTRDKFSVDWWSLKRADRIKSKQLNSQGYFIKTAAKWPLDAQINFGTGKELSLGTDHPCDFGEGELVSSTGLFRTVEGATEHARSNDRFVPLETFPSASALYARKFPETPKTFKMHIKQDGFSYTDLSGTHNYAGVQFTISQSVGAAAEMAGVGNTYGYFGRAVALQDASTLYVGAYDLAVSTSAGNQGDPGRVFKFNYSPDSPGPRGSHWVQDMNFHLTQSDLTSLTSPGNSDFGQYMVATSGAHGNYIAVGAPGRNRFNKANHGGVYVVRQKFGSDDTPGSYQTEAILNATDADNSYRFGQVLEFSSASAGDALGLAVGVPISSSGGGTSGQGRVFVYKSGSIENYLTEENEGWRLEATLDPIGSFRNSQYFGACLSWSGSYLAIGAYAQSVEHNSAPITAGAVHIFKSGSVTPDKGSTSGSWGQVAVITSSHPTSGADFGRSAALFGQRHIVIGEPEGIGGGNSTYTGSAQIWKFTDAGAKSLVQRLNNPVSGELNYYGRFVKAQDQYVAVSRPVGGDGTSNDSNSSEGNRAVLLYKSGSTPGTYTLDQTLTRDVTLNEPNYPSSTPGPWVKNSVANVYHNPLDLRVTNGLPLVIHGIPEAQESSVSNTGDGNPSGAAVGEFRGWHAITTGSTPQLREVTFYMTPSQTDFEIENINYITIVPPHHPDTKTIHPHQTIAYIRLSESATTTSRVVDQIVDGLNSYEGRDNFSSGLRFKDIGRAKPDSDKRAVILEMNQSYQNASLPISFAFNKTLNTGRNKGNSGFTPQIEQFGMNPVIVNMPTSHYVDVDAGGSSKIPLEERRQVADAYFSASISNSTFLAGGAKWTAGDMSNRYPFNFKDYDDYAQQIRLIGQNHSIVSEYRISEEMDNYIGTNSEDPFYSCPQSNFLAITGTDDAVKDSSQNDFYKVYGHSDFVEHFDFVQEELKKIDDRTNPATISLTCKGLKKLLPYEGFYPVQRMTQLATLFSQSYGPGTPVMQENYDNTRTSMGSFRTALAPFYAPGIGFNSIKAGIAVDYPVFVPKMDRPFMEVCTRFSGSAQDTFTTGALGGRSANRVEIGDGLEWAQVFSGSARSATNISSSAISVSMWIYPEAAGTGEPSELSQIQGTLVQFGDKGPATGSVDSSKEILNNGFNFHMSGSNLKLFIRDINGKHVYYSMRSSGSAADKRKIRVNSWNHVGVTLPLGGHFHTDGPPEPPIFFINGLQFSGSLRAGSTGSVPNRFILDIDGKENCTIGNSRSWYTGSYAGREFGPPNAAIAEVCIFNRKLELEDVHGLYGSGSRYRGPWRPDMSVRPRMRDSLVGWYRMGNDTGIMTLSGTISDDANRTNRKPMSNKAWLRYSRKHIIYQLTTGSNFYATGSEQYNLEGDHGIQYPPGTVQISSSLSKAKFRGFAGGYGIVTVNSIDSNHELTGAFKYPSYITGSEFNETADGGIPRIGSASWANHFDSSQDQTLTTWQRVGQGNDKYGIQRIERVPFEAIVDPARSLFSNELKELTEGQFDRRFTLYETEPHPSASLQPCSFVRYAPGPFGYIGKQAYQDRFGLNVKKRDFRKVSVSDRSNNEPFLDDPVGGYAFFGMPNTSSMMTSSFNLTAMTAIGKTKYSEAANNFYAEVMSFFLENGHSTIIASADTPQRPIEYGKTYKMRIRMSRLTDRKDFPLYNLPQAFGPPVDASAKHQSGLTSDLGYDQHFAHGYSGFTPPHYDSYAEVEYSFTPDEGENYELSNPGAIESILTRIAIDNKTTPTIKFNRLIKATGSIHSQGNDAQLLASSQRGVNIGTRTIYSGPTDSSMSIGIVSPVTSSLHKSSAMQMSASFRGLGLDDASLVSTFDNNNPNNPIIRKSLAIQAKWECPNLDFKGVDVKKAFHPGLSVAKGMWHQTGNINNPVTFVEIRPPRDPNDGDLAELLGMHFRAGGQSINPIVKQKSIGTIQDRKIISEAVVAIPFVEQENGQKRFLEFDDRTIKRIYQEVKNTAGFKKYREWDQEIQGDLAVSERERLMPFNNTFISSMVRAMIDHVIPPKFNFLKYNDHRSGKYIKPFMMYCFPFTHTLTKEDLGYIWQNLSPDIALDTFNRPSESIQQEVRSIHSIEGTPLQRFVQEGRLNEIKWIVFKVKKKAENDYFNKMNIDRLPINHPERDKDEKDLFNYGFNWPYDFFSLVELININARTVFDKKLILGNADGSPAEFEIIDENEES